MKSRTFAGIIAVAVASLLCALSLFVPVNYGRTVHAVEKDLSFGLKNGNFNEILDYGYCSMFQGWSKGSDMQISTVPSGIKEEIAENDYCIKIEENASADNKNELYCSEFLQLTKAVDYKAGIKAYFTKGSSAKISVRIAYENSNEVQTFAERAYELSYEQDLLWKDCFVKYESLNGESAKIFVTVWDVKGTIYLDDAYFIRVNPLLTESGAYFKLSTNSAGLRFFGRADKNYVDSLLADDSVNNLTYGILIAPEDSLVYADGFTVSGLGVEPYILMTAETVYNEDTAATDGYYGFACALVDIKQENLNKRFAVRTFLHYEKGYDDCYEYGDFSVDDNVRAFAEVIGKAAENKNVLDENAVNVIEYYVDLFNDN